MNTLYFRMVVVAFVAGSAIRTAAQAQTNVLYLSDVAPSEFTITEGFGRSLRDLSIDGNPLSIGGRSFAKGVGTHAASYWGLYLGGNATRFEASVGVDDEVDGSNVGVEFKIVGGGKLLWESGTMQQGDAPKAVDLDVTGVQRLHLFVTDAGNGNSFDHANWCNARITTTSASLVAQRNTDKYILTPPPGPAPKINSPSLFGVRPGSPFRLKVAATGDKDGMTYSASGLPTGLVIDATTGIITGSIADMNPGSYDVQLHVTNRHGTASQTLKIQVGDDIQLTPAMGWNTWYNYSEAISEAGMRAEAQAMVDSGLIDYGYSYINMDDAWQGRRRLVTSGPNAGDRPLQGNARFGSGYQTGNGDGDLSGMVNFIHGLGLKAGIYSTPWVGTYAGFRGGSADNIDGTYDNQLPPSQLDLRNPEQVYGSCPKSLKAGKNFTQPAGPCWFFDDDARQWAAWGFDYAKIDWNPNDVATTQRILNDLISSGRDIVLSLSNNTPFANVDDDGEIKDLANSWRTAADIGDSWSSISRGFNQEQWAPLVSPGHFNDPDILQLGRLATPNNHNSDPTNTLGTNDTPYQDTNLTPNEQYSHFSLWALLSAPLMIGGDITQLDVFTMNILANDEVIAVNQDPTATQATRLIADGDIIVMGKVLEDGDLAIGIFNTGDETVLYELDLASIGLNPSGGVRLRDLWRQADLGVYTTTFETGVESHGVILFRAEKVIRPVGFADDKIIDLSSWNIIKSGHVDVLP